MSDPTPSHEALPLIEALLEGTIDNAGFARLDELLREDPGARKLYRSLANLDAALPGMVGNTPRVSIQITEADDNTLLESSELPSADLMDVLVQAEEQGRAIDPMVMAKQRFAGETPSSKAPTLSLNDWLQAGRYLLRHSLTPKRVATLAAAAVVALLTMVLVLAWPSDPAIEPVVDQSYDNSIPVPARAVAMLTAELNAQWSTPSGTLSPSIGDALHVGQRLSLTEGFAQITTNRGAVATLEAPATIELLDNNNAIRLHTGKLVGICETELSKGFLVRAPHMDITDLGTRFGVDATERGRTDVHVFEGEIESATIGSTHAPSERRRLMAGHALVAQPEADLQLIAFDPGLFVIDLDIERLRPRFADTNTLWKGQLSGELGQDMREADALQVFLERRGLVLSEDAAVDFNHEHQWDPQASVGQHRVTAGERVDVYLLHFDLPDGHEDSETFVINFDRPILGVIVSQEGLNKSDTLLGTDGVRYPIFKAGGTNGPRGLNNRAVDAQSDLASIEFKDDLAVISPDGTQLQLRLWGGEPGVTASMDQVRVIVQAQARETNDF
jgi:hypothetical protein